MFIETFGRGPRVFVGLHGWSGDHRTYSPLTKNLPPYVTFHSIDLPGYGQSPPPADWSFQSVSDDLTATVSGLGSAVSLVGTCAGGIFALEIARRLPEQVERVIALDIFAFWPWYFRLFVTEPFGRYAYMSTFANPIGRWLTNGALAGKRSGDSNLTDGFARVNHRVSHQYLKLLENQPVLEDFAAVRAPVEIVRGEKSFEAVRESAARFLTILPNARETVLRGAGHLPIREATAQLQEVLFENHHAEESSCPNSTLVQSV